MLTYHFNLENVHKHIILMWKTFTFNILLKKNHVYYKTLKVKKIFNILNKYIMHIFLLFLDLGFVRLSIEVKGFIL